MSDEFGQALREVAIALQCRNRRRAKRWMRKADEAYRREATERDYRAHGDEWRETIAVR